MLYTNNVLKSIYLFTLIVAARNSFDLKGEYETKRKENLKVYLKKLKKLNRIKAREQT
jgi:hypothetical protein